MEQARSPQIEETQANSCMNEFERLVYLPQHDFHRLEPFLLELWRGGIRQFPLVLRMRPLRRAIHGLGESKWSSDVRVPNTTRMHTLCLKASSVKVFFDILCSVETMRKVVGRSLTRSLPRGHSSKPYTVTVGCKAFHVRVTAHS
jgi:hypothetical protein